MTAPFYTVFMLENNVRIGEIEYKRLEAANRYLKRGRWEMSVASLPGPVTWKSRIEIARNGVIVFSGPFDQLERQWTYAEVDTQDFTGVCDNVFMERELASPDPSLSGPPYNTQTHDVRTAVAETAIRNYIRFNIGPNAVSARQVSGLTMATDLGRGSTITGRARFENLLTFCKGLAVAGGVGFEIVGLQARFYVPTDKSSSVIFSVELDNLKEYEYKGASPKANYIIVGGGGTGTARTFYELGDSTSISQSGRRVEFIDARNTTVTGELAQKAQEALDDKAIGDITIHVVPGAQAIEYMKPYDNFYLGDTVTVVIDGAPIQAQVQEVGFLDTKDEVREHLTVGNFGKGAKQVEVLDLINNISTRVKNLEVQ